MSSTASSTNFYSGPTRDLVISWQDQQTAPRNVNLELQNGKWLKVERRYLWNSNQFTEDESSIREVQFLASNVSEKHFFHFSRFGADATLTVTITEPVSLETQTYSVRLVNDTRICPHMILQLQPHQNPQMYYLPDGPSTWEGLSRSTSRLLGISANAVLTISDGASDALGTVGKAAACVGAVVEKLWNG